MSVSPEICCQIRVGKRFCHDIDKEVSQCKLIKNKTIRGEVVPLSRNCISGLGPLWKILIGPPRSPVHNPLSIYVF